MPDNNGGILSGLGNFFNNIAGNMDPEWQLRRYQMQLYKAQVDNLQRQNPGMDINEAMYRLSPEGQREQYGYSPGQPIEPGPGVRIPTYIHGGQPIIGVPGAGTQGQPSQQPAASQPQPQGPAPGAPPGMTQMQPYIDWAQQLEARKAATVEAAKQTATAQPDLPILQNRTSDLIKQLEGIRDDPELPNVVGGFLGIKGRTTDLGGHQAKLVGNIQDANNALQGDLFSSMRTMSNGGRPPSIGAMKEMRITDLMKSRTMGVGDYKGLLNDMIQRAQNEYGAAWEARGRPDAYKPNWGQSQPAQSAGPKRITNEQDYAQVKSGEHYTDPTGVLRVKR